MVVKIPSFLGYSEVWIDKYVPTFQRRRLRPSSESKNSKRNIFVSPIDSLFTTVVSYYLRYKFFCKAIFLLLFGA